LALVVSGLVILLVLLLVLFQVSVVVANDADKSVDGGADSYEVAEVFEDGRRAEPVVEPRGELEPDADVGRELETERSGRDDRPA
jgi:hypothetical protein